MMSHKYLVRIRQSLQMVSAVAYLVTILVLRGVVSKGVCPSRDENGQNPKHPGVLGGVVNSLRLNPKAQLNG